MNNTPRPQIAAYYFPNWHVDPRNERVHGTGWTEWEVLKCARARFEGHQQPRVPVHGYEDEADPAVMARKIDLAADHGVDAFIFDWYWYDGLFRGRALEEGFLKAANNSRIKFGLMLCNHEGKDLHPAKEHTASPSDDARTLYPCVINEEVFEQLTDYALQNYFPHPSYWLVDGCPYFSIYLPDRFVTGLGGIDNARAALERFRQKARAAGFPDLHLNAIVDFTPELWRLSAEIKFDSMTCYGWPAHYECRPEDFPEADYNAVRDSYLANWTKLRASADLPYYPVVQVGWDCSPRTIQSDMWENLSYPYLYIFKNNTPENFRNALQLIRDELSRCLLPTPFIAINAWNEWTEGAYLEPDIIHGTAYLEAVKNTFEK